MWPTTRANQTDETLESQLRVTDRTNGMKAINYFSLDIFQRLQRWRTSEDVNNSSISGSRPWRKAAEKVSPITWPVVSAWHTKMVAQTAHDTPTATTQPRALPPDHQRRGLRQADFPSREPQTARLLLVRHPDFATARDRCADRVRARTAMFRADRHCDHKPVNRQPMADRSAEIRFEYRDLDYFESLLS